VGWLRRCAIGFAASCMFLLPALLSSPAAQAAACSTANPTVETNPGGLPETPTAAWINEWFTKARQAEGCNVPMVVPANFEGMTPAQQLFWLINSEREARGLTPYKLDGTLMSQIALNHDNEETTYGYEAHTSAINQGSEIGQRECVNPALKGGACGYENIFFLPPAETVYGWMYIDGPSWGHRMNLLLPSAEWVGIGALHTKHWYITADFLGGLPNYAPPAKADTNGPMMGAISYANGTATVTAVADSPMNVNDIGANPLTAGVTEVSFYTNNIVAAQPGNTLTTFNTIRATQTAPGSGTWTAPITMNAGEVLHAVAVDGSGNFTDSAPPAPPAALKAGENTVALPAEGGTTAPAEEPVEEEPVTATTARKAAASPRSVPAVTPTAAALVASIDKQLKGKVVESVRVYVNGHWKTYRPGRSKSFALYTNEGVVITMKRGGRWKPATRLERYSAPRVRLHRGWNFVAVPYPVTGMTCHAVRLELAGKGDRLKEISVGTKPNEGVIMKPVHGKWGNDLMMHIPNSDGFWIDDAGSTNWTPNPEGFTQPEQKL